MAKGAAIVQGETKSLEFPQVSSVLDTMLSVLPATLHVEGKRRLGGTLRAS